MTDKADDNPVDTTEDEGGDDGEPLPPGENPTDAKDDKPPGPQPVADDDKKPPPPVVDDDNVPKEKDPEKKDEKKPEEKKDEKDKGKTDEKKDDKDKEKSGDKKDEKKDDKKADPQGDEKKAPEFPPLSQEVVDGETVMPDCNPVDFVELEKSTPIPVGREQDYKVEKDLTLIFCETENMIYYGYGYVRHLNAITLELQLLLQYEKKLLEQVMTRIDKFKALRDENKRKATEWEENYKKRQPEIDSYVTKLLDVPHNETMLMSGVPAPVQQKILFQIVFRTANTANGLVVATSMEEAVANDIDLTLQDIKKYTAVMVKQIDTWLKMIKSQLCHQNKLMERWVEARALLREYKNREEDTKSVVTTGGGGGGGVDKQFKRYEERLIRIEKALCQLCGTTQCPEICNAVSHDPHAVKPPQHQPEPPHVSPPSPPVIQTGPPYVVTPPPIQTGPPNVVNPSTIQTDPTYVKNTEVNQTEPGVTQSPQPSYCPPCPMDQSAYAQSQPMYQDPCQIRQQANQSSPYCDPIRGNGSPGSPGGQFPSPCPPTPSTPGTDGYFEDPYFSLGPATSPGAPCPGQLDPAPFCDEPISPGCDDVPLPWERSPPKDANARLRAPPGAFPGIELVDTPGIGYPIPRAALEKGGRRPGQVCPLSPPQQGSYATNQMGRFRPLAASSPPGVAAPLRAREAPACLSPHPMEGQPVDPALLPKIQCDLQKLGDRNRNLQDLVRNFKKVRSTLTDEIDKAVRLNQKLQRDLYYVAESQRQQQ